MAVGHVDQGAAFDTVLVAHVESDVVFYVELPNSFVILEWEAQEVAECEPVLMMCVNEETVRKRAPRTFLRRPTPPMVLPPPRYPPQPTPLRNRPRRGNGPPRQPGNSSHPRRHLSDPYHPRNDRNRHHYYTPCTSCHSTRDPTHHQPPTAPASPKNSPTTSPPPQQPSTRKQGNAPRPISTNRTTSERSPRRYEKE